MLASLKIDMGIIKIRHFLPDHIDNASLTSHCLIHIPKKRYGYQPQWTVDNG